MSERPVDRLWYREKKTRLLERREAGEGEMERAFAVRGFEETTSGAAVYSGRDPPRRPPSSGLPVWRCLSP